MIRLRNFITTTLTWFFIASTMTALNLNNILSSDNQLQPVNPVAETLDVTPQQIDETVLEAISRVKAMVAAINAIPAADRTFENTILARDRTNYLIKTVRNQLVFYSLLNFDPAIVNRANTAAALFDFVRGDDGAYKALKEYEANGMQQESLTAEQRYWIQNLKQSYKREGLHLNPLKQKMIRIWQAQLDDIMIAYQDNTKLLRNATIEVTLDGMAGLSNSLIANLPRNGDLYILPAVSALTLCTVEATRHAAYDAFYQLAFPVNAELLTKAKHLRNKIANLTGFQDYATLEAPTLMAKSVENIDQFLNELITQTTPSDTIMFDALTADLPPDVTLDEHGKIKPWDLQRVSYLYETSNFVNESVIAQYLPINTVFPALLRFFESLYGVEIFFAVTPPSWAGILQLLEVFRKSDGEFLGYIYVDMHARLGKSLQAQTLPIFWSISNPDGSIFQPGFAAVTAALPSSTTTQQALLPFDQAKTIFHELGHAMHLLVGTTHIAGQSGFQAKVDFIEMPSLMLEQIFARPEFLKYISRHYQTGEPMPDDLIDGVRKWKQFSFGNFVLAQGTIGKFALDFYRDGFTDNADQLVTAIFNQYMTHYATDAMAHTAEQMPHLISIYYAAYYGYMWSIVIALDVFDTINQAGIFDPEISQKYITDIISKGGSRNPAGLLKNFLDRPFNNEAFLAYLNGKS